MMPYMAPMYLMKNGQNLPDSQFSYPDVFDPKVQKEIKTIIQRVVREQKDNPNLIGYYWTDTPQWDLERSSKMRGTDCVSAIRSLSADAPGKKRYEQFIAEGGKEEEDFLCLIARELYKVLGEETLRLDPDALIFGERYEITDHPDCVIEEALPYIDVLSIQPGGAKCQPEHFDSLHAAFKKPIMICDHKSSFPTPEYSKTLWELLESEEAAGQAYAQYLKDAFEKPYIIGYQRCQYIDRFDTHRGILKQGMLREDGTPY
jgi:hypothetical protein